jgi:DNA-binding CsgD family transcriptional regulator
MPLAHEGQAGERHASGRGGLSSRELEVLCQAAHGEGDSGIATALSLSRNSVKTYWQRIREKLAVKTREEALREAVMQGLIPDRRRRHSYADGMAESLGTAALSGFTMTSV